MYRKMLFAGLAGTLALLQPAVSVAQASAQASIQASTQAGTRVDAVAGNGVVLAQFGPPPGPWGPRRPPRRWGPPRPPLYGPPPPVFVPPPPVYVPPRPPVFVPPAIGYLPPAHVRWCAGRYRSYNPATNMYLARGGVWRVCRSPFM